MFLFVVQYVGVSSRGVKTAKVCVSLTKWIYAMTKENIKYEKISTIDIDSSTIATPIQLENSIDLKQKVLAWISLIFAILAMSAIGMKQHF